MTLAVTKSKAEQALPQQFEAVVSALPGNGWMRDARGAAMGAFVASGLPHRRIESWKYTDLRSALKDANPPAAPYPGQIGREFLVAAVGADLASLEATVVVVVNGRVAAMSTAGETLKPETGVSIASLTTALAAPDALRLKIMMDADKVMTDRAMIDLNTAFASDGVVVRVAAGTKLARPLHMVFVTDSGAPSATTVRSLVEIGAGAEMTLIESHVARVGAPHQVNAVTQIVVGDEAVVDHVKVLADGGDGLHWGAWLAELGANAAYRAFQMTAGGGLVRNETVVTYRGEGGKADISGVMLGRGRDHIDTTLVVDHAVPGCESRELFKAVLDDTARGIFQGRVIVRPDAQKSDGKQMAQALMLSETAEFDSKPELEIYADDVVCGHGSTTAELDPDLLFYCLSRGIPKAEARRLLIESFVGEAFEKVAHPAVAEVLAGIARDWLARGAGGDAASGGDVR